VTAEEIALMNLRGTDLVLKQAKAPVLF
jgi:hypothetical protein